MLVEPGTELEEALGLEGDVVEGSGRSRPVLVDEVDVDHRMVVEEIARAGE